MPAYGEQYAFFDEAPYRNEPVLSEAEVEFAAETAVESAAMEHYDKGRRFAQGVLQLI